MKTRKERAVELLELLERGPSLHRENSLEEDKYAIEQYRLWARSWIIHTVKDLIPELRKLEKHLQ